MIHLRDSLVNNLIKHAEGQIAKHKANVEIYFTYPTGIGEHPDIIASVDSEIEKLTNAEEKLQTIKNL